MNSDASSSHKIVNNISDLDNTLDDDLEEIENETKKKGRQFGKSPSTYDPYCSFKTVEVAKSILKNPFLASNWTQLNTIDNKIWFKCKNCNERIKLTVESDGRCLVHS